MNRPVLIAVSGSIASGKTLICKWLEADGHRVIYADAIAHGLLEEDDVKEKILEVFGDGVFSQGKVNRKKLAAVAFRDRNLLSKLNGIIHPAVRLEMDQIIKTAAEDFLFFEIPLLFENGLQKCFDLTLNVTTSPENQFSRLKDRNNLTDMQITERLASQMNSFEKEKLADINIENNGSIPELKIKLQSLLPLIKKIKPKPVKSLLDL